MRKIHGIFMAVVFCLPGVVLAQKEPIFQVESHLVDSTVSVHDAQGGLVHDLTQDDLLVLEDGVAQKIRFFSPAEQLPLSIGLVIDASGSQDKFAKQHEKDIAAFLSQVLAPDDRAFAVCFGNHVRLVSDWSNSPAEIVAPMPAFDHDPKKFPELGPKEDRDLGTALNDAVYFSVTEKMAEIKGRRKVLVVFSDGEENSSEHDLIDAIESAWDANVLVYAIRYTEEKHGKMTARDRYGMRELDHLTAQTGGKSYDSGSMNLSQAFAEIAGELRSLYAVGYHSSNTTHDGTFRRVVIKGTRPGLVMRSREGYYAK